MSTVASPGCVVFLLDESAGMGAVMGEVVAHGKASNKPNAERVATALNSLLNQLTRGPDFDVALVGYQTDAGDEAHVGSRWGGALAGREFVTVREMAAAPLRVETRTRKLPAPGGIGLVREEQVSFPVWYEPALGVKAPQIAAFGYCRDLLARWLATAGPDAGLPLVVHVFSGASGDGNPQKAVAELMGMATPAGTPLLFQAHVASLASAVTAHYPSSHVYLTVGSARDVFRRASPLPPHLVAALKEAKTPVNANARGMLYNASIMDLIRFFGLVTAHAKSWPSQGAPVPPAPEPMAIPGAPVAPIGAAAVAAAPLAPAPAEDEPIIDLAAVTTDAGAAATIELVPETPVPVVTEKAALLVLLLDRSVEDPFSGNTQNACAKLQEHANDLLKQVSALKEGAVDVAVVSYGLDPGGQVELRTTLEGPLAGQTVVPHTALESGALRVEEFQEEISNGLGGLITVTRKKPVFLELEPTAAAPPAEALVAVARIAADWCALHPNACVPPIVLHLTRGRGDAAALEQAVGPLKAVSIGAGPLALYHLVVTEAPHKSIAYAQAAADFDDPGLQALWALTSPLLGRERLGAQRPAITPESRGMVVNGKFDLLLEEVKRALAT